MKITYIYHSGFAVETESSLLVFDYWKDPARVAAELLRSPKPMYVFASHFHEDHFCREVLEWRRLKPDTTYIFSKDILRHRRAAREEADVWLGTHGHWADGRISATAAGSTDSGVSWIVEADGHTIYHAGDNNNWYARLLTSTREDDIAGGIEFPPELDPQREEKRYLGELKEIGRHTDHFDVAMFPIDARIGNGYTSGARQFLERFAVKLLVPMHFSASGFESIRRMKEFADAAGTEYWCIKENGEWRRES
jgi:L-ascorbate metabolism protein UlaG (beta-lactamase superfamily)